MKSTLTLINVKPNVVVLLENRRSDHMSETLIEAAPGLANIVAADTVQGNVTLRLVNVPWDQALDIVLRAKGLDKRRDGAVVWVAPQPELAKFEQDKEDAAR